MATRQLVIFSINDEEFGIDIEQVNIIERPMEIFKIPNTPDFVEGLVNLRGKVHTVFNMRKRFKMPVKEFDDNTKIIMANTGSAVVGLVVDEVKEIIKVEDSDIESTPKVLMDMKRKYVSGIAKVENRIILLLDLDIILSVEEPERAIAN
jgi:purine-binding chemotaxis protein CheW